MTDSPSSPENPADGEGHEPPVIAPIGRLTLLLFALAACQGNSVVAAGAPPGTTDTTTTVTGFVITGDPTSTAGASWTYKATSNGVTYDLEGTLRKPVGTGPFPAVIISHGFGGNARGYSSNVGAEMVKWGMVTIATNYTHASGVPLGAPGLATERGASAPNVLRGLKMLDLLRSLGYVDMQRVAAHGHSMGAFLTAALVGAAPGSFRAASHTAGGVRPPSGSTEFAAPVDSQVAHLTTPYQMHHGDVDIVVPLSMDQRLDSLLAARNVVRELHVYPGAGHDDVPFNRTMYDRVRAWYQRHGVVP